MKNLILPLFILFAFNSYSQIYQTNYLEVFEDGKKVGGSAESDKIEVNEDNNKIIISNPNPEYKTFILKIKKKFKDSKYDKVKKDLVDDDDAFVYACELINQHGVQEFFLIVNTFYQTIKLIGVSDNGENYALWHYNEVK